MEVRLLVLSTDVEKTTFHIVRGLNARVALHENSAHLNFTRAFMSKHYMFCILFPRYIFEHPEPRARSARGGECAM